MQEIVNIYPSINPPTLTAHQSNRVCNALALLQCVASHPETRWVQPLCRHSQRQNSGKHNIRVRTDVYVCVFFSFILMTNFLFCSLDSAYLNCVSNFFSRSAFLAAHIPLFLYPFLHTVSKTRPFEYLRLTSLGVIGKSFLIFNPCLYVISCRLNVFVFVRQVLW